MKVNGDWDCHYALGVSLRIESRTCFERLVNDDRIFVNYSFRIVTFTWINEENRIHSCGQCVFSYVYCALNEPLLRQIVLKSAFKVISYLIYGSFSRHFDILLAPGVASWLLLNITTPKVHPPKKIFLLRPAQQPPQRRAKRVYFFWPPKDMSTQQKSNSPKFII